MILAHAVGLFLPLLFPQQTRGLHGGACDRQIGLDCGGEFFRCIADCIYLNISHRLDQLGLPANCDDLLEQAAR
jgi:hypothetical protein